jgi:Hormone-sensitive lipase (HSL) N-terminus
MFITHREVAAYSELLNSLLIMGNSLVENHKTSEDTCLYSEVGIYENTVRKTAESLNLESFYGRVFGFQVRLYD